MPEFSTLLRQRLRATEDRTLQHPDPDTLNAYVEELLPTQEREQVLQHISHCSPCREIVALATPESDLTSDALATAPLSVAGATPRKRWFLSPAFGLAGSVAAMILGVALILRLSAPHSPVRQIQEAQARPAAVPNPAANARSAEMPEAPAPASVQPSNSSADFAEHAETAPVKTAASNSGAISQPAMQRERRATASRTPVVVADLRGQDFVNKTFLTNAYDTQPATAVYRDLPQAPVPSQANLGFAPPAVVAGTPFQGTGNFVIPSKAAGANRGVTFYSTEIHSGGSTTLLGKIVDFGKRPLTKHLGPPIPSGSLGERAMFKPGASTVQPSDAIGTAKTDAASPAGLAGSPAFTRRALEPSARAQIAGVSQYQWKVVQGKLLRSSDLSHWTEENPAGENLEFSVVSPNGLEIWAGGNEAALVHSHDGGATWERITLGAAATGTINSIEAAGQNVLVKSSSGQSWASQDGGKSWLLN